MNGKTNDGRGAAAQSRISPEHFGNARARRSGAGQDVKVGLFVILGVIAVVAALFLLTDPGTMRGRYHVTTVVQDAGGIRKGDPVQMRGVNIGRVRGFTIGAEGVRVRLELENEYPVPQDSRVALRSNGLLGGLVADIVPGSASEYLEEGDELRGVGAQESLEETAAGLSARADDLLGRAQAVLSDQTVTAVNASAVELQRMLADLAALAQQQRAELGATSASLRRAAAGLEGATTRPELERAIARTDSITLQLDAATAQLAQASGSLQVVMGRLERGEGTLGKLSQDASLYENLNRAAVNMSRAAENASALTADIQENPKKYINVRVF